MKKTLMALAILTLFVIVKAVSAWPILNTGRTTYNNTSEIPGPVISETVSGRIGPLSVAKGDVKGSGGIDLADAILALQVVSGLAPLIRTSFLLRKYKRIFSFMSS